MDSDSDVTSDSEAWAEGVGSHSDDEMSVDGSPSRVANFHQFRWFPDEVKAKVVCFALLPEGNLWRHLHNCTLPLCDKIEHFVARAEELKATGPELERLVTTCDAALYCILIDIQHTFSAMDYPSFADKAAATMSIDIHHPHFDGQHAQQLAELLPAMRNIIRLSIGGTAQPFQEQVVSASLKQSVTFIGQGDMSNLEVLLLDVDIDFTKEIRGSLGVSRLRVSYKDATFEPESVVTWGRLKDLDLDFRHVPRSGTDHPEILEAASRDSMPHLETLSLRFHNNSSRIVEQFLLGPGRNVVDLTIFCGPWGQEIRMSSCQRLENLTCIVDSAKMLVHVSQPSLKSITLHGMGPASPEHPRPVQLRSTSLMDDFLWAVVERKLAPSLEVVTLKPFDAAHFVQHIWDLRESSVYGYWGRRASGRQKGKFKQKGLFRFQDKNGKRILPKGLQLNIRRKPPSGF